MNQLKQYPSLLWTRLVVAKQNFIDFLLTATTYYFRWDFAKIDLFLLAKYFWKNPYRIASRYLQERGEDDVYTYGETPLTTMHLIVEKSGITKDDSVLELGCGRGRTCFWLREVIGCSVIGIEQVPIFVKIANEVKEKFHIERLEFLQGDYFTLDWGTPSVIYLYGSTLSDEEINTIAKKIKLLPSGTKVISVSFPIPGLMLSRRFQLPFTWGEADVYVQTVL